MTSRQAHSDTAIKFADSILSNYIAVDSKFSPTLWAKPPDLLFPYIQHKQWRWVLSHSPECGTLCETYKHIRFCWCAEKNSAVSECFNKQHVTTGAEVKVQARQDRVCGCCILWLSFISYHKNGISEESVSSLWTENSIVTMLLLLKYRFYPTLTLTFICLFSCSFSMRFIHYSRAFSYISNMHFHRQLMCFHKTPDIMQQNNSVAHFIQEIYQQKRYQNVMGYRNVGWGYYIPKTMNTAWV